MPQTPTGSAVRARCCKRGVGAVLVSKLAHNPINQEKNGVFVGVGTERRNFMEKKHISLWLDAEILNNCDANQKLTKAKNRSEYINQKVVNTMHGMIESLERHLARQLFKQAVETAKIFWLVVKGFNIEPEDVDDFHADCVEEVKRINGAIRYPFKSKSDDE